MGEVFRNNFLCDETQFSELAAGVRPDTPHSLRYGTNPLVRKPIVALNDGRLVAPVLKHVICKATPECLYFDGIHAAKNRFTVALGEAFEWYVGSQIQALVGATVFREIVYQENKHSKKSADVIAVLPDLVLVIEAKASRMNAKSKSDVAPFYDDIAKKVIPAVDQVERTCQLIAQRKSEFLNIPGDRPIMGLVVTLEPYHLHDFGVKPSSGDDAFRVRVCSSRDLEVLVSLGVVAASKLVLDLADEGSRESVSEAVVQRNIPIGLNSVLERSWKTFSVAERNAWTVPWRFV